ncbi:MAG: YezD family protein [Terriglobales bacterium]
MFAEILRALKTMRYGSIVLTVHDGHMVELSKTVRLRTKPAK